MLAPPSAFLVLLKVFQVRVTNKPIISKRVTIVLLLGQKIRAGYREFQSFRGALSVCVVEKDGSKEHSDIVRRKDSSSNREEKNEGDL